MLLASWGVLIFIYLRGVNISLDRDSIKYELEQLGPVKRDELAIGFAFGVMIVLFIIRPYLIAPYLGRCTLDEDGNSTIISGVNEESCPGDWSSFLSDGAIACLAALILFFFPSNNEKDLGEKDLASEDENIRKKPHQMVLTQAAFFDIRW